MERRSKKAELQFKVQLDKVYDVDLDSDLSISETNINEELSQQPALFAWHAVISELAKAKVLSLKNELEVLEAELDQKIRRGWDVDIHGKMTEAGIQSAIKLTIPYRSKQEIYFQAKKNEGILLVAKQAFEQRKDMLISISSNMRNAFDTNLHINKEKVADKIKRLHERE